MNCAEFNEELPELLELQDNVAEASRHPHLRQCEECAELLSEMHRILSEARTMQASDEPDPQVWNLIEIALRQEGLIKDAPTRPFLVDRPHRTWRLAWLAPVAVALLIGLGVVRYEHGVNSASSNAAHANGQEVADLGDDDRQLLNEVSQRNPALRANYETDLRNVNSYIRNAKASALSDPNDALAQQALLGAYEQRSMVYQMAADRTLP